MVEFVAVDRPDVIEAQFLEQRSAGEEASAVFLGALDLVVDKLRQMLGQLLGRAAE